MSAICKKSTPHWRSSTRVLASTTGVTALIAGKIFPGREYDQCQPGVRIQPLPAPAGNGVLAGRPALCEYARPEHFVTHNFDFEWRGYSFGVQPRVDHFAAAQCLSVAGVDIYHPSRGSVNRQRDRLWRRDHSWAGKKGNYFVLETRGAGISAMDPPIPASYGYRPSAMASGASMVSYWHWHSIHNAFGNLLERFAES